MKKNTSIENSEKKSDKTPTTNDDTIAENTKKETKSQLHGYIKVLFDGMLNIRRGASPTAPIAGFAIKGAQYDVIELCDNKYYKLKNGMFILADKKLVEFHKY